MVPRLKNSIAVVEPNPTLFPPCRTVGNVWEVSITVNQLRTMTMLIPMLAMGQMFSVTTDY